MSEKKHPLVAMTELDEEIAADNPGYMTGNVEFDRMVWLKWAEQVIRDHTDQHGPSGGAWNISMLLDAFKQAAIERGEPWGDVG
jgi:hypothetical protein